MIHALIIKSPFFEDLITCRKTFELRENDRDFQVGDFLALNEIDSHGDVTGRSALVYVTYILRDSDFLKENFVGMSVKPCLVLKVPDLTEIPDAENYPEINGENFSEFLEQYITERKKNYGRTEAAVIGFGE